MNTAAVSGSAEFRGCRRLISAGYPPITFPTLVDRVSDEVHLGRNPRHGYARGWGLEFGGLGDQVEAHPLFREALAASRHRSVVHPHRLMNLFLIVACFFDGLDHHSIAEFGTYRGGSALFLAKLLKELYPEAEVLAYDTFVGMPETNRRVDLHGAGDFSDADLEGLLEARSEQGLFNLKLVQGLVQETFPASIDPSLRLGLAHLDMDVFGSTYYVQTRIWDLMARGGYIVYDDATVSGCMGATQAVEELIMVRSLHSEQIYPHFVFRAGLGH